MLTATWDLRGHPAKAFFQRSVNGAERKQGPGSSRAGTRTPAAPRLDPQVLSFNTHSVSERGPPAPQAPTACNHTAPFPPLRMRTTLPLLQGQNKMPQTGKPSCSRAAGQPQLALTSVISSKKRGCSGGGKPGPEVLCQSPHHFKENLAPHSDPGPPIRQNSRLRPSTPSPPVLETLTEPSWDLSS